MIEFLSAILPLIGIVLLVTLVLDPSIWLALLAYPSIRQLRQHLGAGKQPLKHLLRHAATHANPSVRTLARRIIVMHLIAGGILLLGVLLIFERCYVGLPFFNVLGTCTHSPYSPYTLFIPLGLSAYLLYFLWDFTRLFKQANR